MGFSSYQHHRCFLAFLIHTAAANTAFLDKAILSDLLHHPTTCSSDTASETTFTFTYPGSNSGAEWDPDAVEFEEGLFQAMMSHADANGTKSWDIRIGTSGNIYSHFVGGMYGETMSPQAGYEYGTPWVDEVFQMVSVNLDLNQNLNSRFCPNDATVDTDCDKNFVHQAGAYANDSPYTDTSPVYSPSLAKHCSGNACSFASWGTQAHLATPFVSHIMYITRFMNCGNGIIEHTQMIHNFAPETSLALDTDYNYFNVGWGGVRSSKLPYALEPLNNQELVYDDPNTVDYLPLCRWGVDAVAGGPAGRAEDTNIDQLGGYTTFVGDGLIVNRTMELQTWCRKSSGCDSNNVASCMQESCTDDEIANGFTRIELGIPPGGPDCKFHNYANPYGAYVSIKCYLRNDQWFGYTRPYASNPDGCAPWKDSRIAFENTATGATLEVAYVRHWSWSLGNYYVYFSVFIENTGSAAQSQATGMVNSMFAAGPSFIPIKLKTVHMSSVKPWCRKPGAGCTAATASTCMVQSCTEDEIANDGFTRIELGIPPEGPACQFHNTTDPYQGFVALECNLRTSQNFGYIADVHETTPIGLYRAYSGMTLEIAYIKHWSQNVDDFKVYFSVYIDDDGIEGTGRQQAIDMVNTMFSNVGTTTVPLEIRSLSETGIGPVPTSYNPAALPTFTYVYGQGSDYSTVAGYGRRRIGSAVDTRDYTVFTVNWMGGARLKAGETYLNQGFMFSSELGSVEATAIDLSDKVKIDEIGLEEWNPRTIGIYQDSTSFAAIAASSASGVSTACSALETPPVCSGKSTPQQGYSPFFYVTCGASSYFGPDPYHFAPPFGNSFPGHGDVAQEHCILVTTGSGEWQSGYVNIMVNSGNGFVEVSTPNQFYETNEVVLDQCFSNILAVQVNNPPSMDTWTGSILLSTDGKLSYFSMTCDDCPGTQEVSHYSVACGSSLYGCANQTQVARVDELHEVKCCSDTSKQRWGLDYTGNCMATLGRDVWAASFKVGCPKANHTAAEAICTAADARLCTEEELLADCATATGCGFDYEMIWSSTATSTLAPTTVPTTTMVPTTFPLRRRLLSHFSVACGSSLYGCAGQTQVAKVDEQHKVKCCSDTWKRRWGLDYTGNCMATLGRDVWAASHKVMCPEANHTAAEAICTDYGARLCTEEELLADCATATGCGFDYEMIWSSTATAVPTTTPPSEASSIPPPSEAPSVPPSEAPSVPPSEAPSVPPSEAPSEPPSEAPSVHPSEAPSEPPSEAPSLPPSEAPSEPPSEAPSLPPSAAPSVPPSEAPSVPPSEAPSVPPPSEAPSVQPPSTQCFGGNTCTFSAQATTVPPPTVVSNVRSYACEGEDVSVRPTWKLIGFFDASDSECAGLESFTYDETLCDGVFR